MKQRDESWLLRSNSNLQILETLGSGAFGVIYKVKCIPSGNIYALKKVSLSGLSIPQQREALKEVVILGKVSHPNIITYVTSFLEKSSLNLIIQYAPGGDLLKVFSHYK